MLDTLVGLDDCLTDTLPRATAPDEPAEWLTLRARDGSPALITPTGREMLLCWESRRYTDRQLLDIVADILAGGWLVTGMRGCPRGVVAEAHYHGVPVLLNPSVARTLQVESISFAVRNKGA